MLYLVKTVFNYFFIITISSNLELRISYKKQHLTIKYSLIDGTYPTVKDFY